MNPQTPTDFMSEALRLAESQGSCVLPNPKVGAVIVYKNKIVGSGFHRGPGTAHGEIAAVHDAKRRGFKKFRSATLYVTLEPCCHLKKRTPPCAQALIEIGFKKIVIAHLDPNPQVSGKGVRLLRRAKISVQVGLLKEQSELINQAFIKNQTQKLPYITLKIATTFDGKMADDFSKSKWITSDLARADVHVLRRQVDSIGVGSRTVSIDRPHLNARVKNKKDPKKIVIFGKLKAPSALKNIIHANGAENVIQLPSSKASGLKNQIRSLYNKMGICHLMIEGGPRLASSFLKAGLVDELVIYQGRGILGGLGAHSIGRAWGLKSLQSSIRFQPDSVSLLGPDVKIRGLINVYRSHSKFR